MPLKDYFQRIAVISLPQREDRRTRLMENLRQTGLAEDADITWVEAVNGEQCQLPDWWQIGAGAWGCRASQLAVLEAAQRDGLESVLILEDDAHFHNRTAEWLASIIPLLPVDWDFFYLGGQHMADPSPTQHPKLLMGKGITRTHAYAVHSRAFTTLIQQVGDLSQYQQNPTWHIDHQYAIGQADGLWKAYAPAWWFAAQDGGHSDIAWESFPRRWWPHGNQYWFLPFVTTPLTDTEWVYYLDSITSQIPEDKMSRSLWLRDLAREAWIQGKLPSCNLSPAEIAQLWSGGHQAVQTLAELAHLADYPANQLFPHPFAD